MSEDRPEDRPEDRAGDPIGDLGEEAAKLLGVLAGFARDVDEHVATGAPECQWCPVCRVVHAVRTTSPEVGEHLRSAAGSLLQAAAGLLAAGTPPPSDGSTAGSGGDTAKDAAAGDPPEGSDGLQHIDLDDPGEGP